MKRTFALMIAVLMLVFSVLSFSVCAADTTDPAYVYFMPPTEGSVAWTGFNTFIREAAAAVTQAEEGSKETERNDSTQVKKAADNANDSTGEKNEAAEDTANPDGINIRAATIGIIIVCVVFACAIIVVVIILSKKNKKNG